ncbi:hypothetical protein HHK36_018901 [Tetracentron sinense]|uniref:Sugar phosphate transporter domain-containing protein n=1 Tax=Tetracentron sinense TaxID=13715 RepID=A0A834YV86_TETSI|nr:hypothetical protein HHK36_018901 [Tetracentron sinense]
MRKSPFFMLWFSLFEKRKISTNSPMKEVSGRLFTVGLVTAWYSSNIGVLLLNKYLLSNYGFKYPIFLTMCHMTACSVMSYASIAWIKMVPMQTIGSRIQFMKISALSLVFCTSVVSGNISLRFLPVSFNQAIGATTPFFTAVFAYIMTVKRESWLTYVTLIPVVTGVIIASGVGFPVSVLFTIMLLIVSCYVELGNWGEPSFHLFGFIMCVGATAARALKTVLQGILLSSEGEKLNSMNLLMYMAPIAVVFLLPATLLMEGNVVGITQALARKDINIVWYLLFNSTLAYFVNLTNFLVTKHTSALTLQVCLLVHMQASSPLWFTKICDCRQSLQSKDEATRSEAVGMEFPLGEEPEVQGGGQPPSPIRPSPVLPEAPAEAASADPAVLGNAKGAVAVVVSILIFKNPISVIGMFGYAITVTGVVLYSEAKKRSK